MKSCPTCNRTFEDTLTFCLVDGSILSAPFDPRATLVLPNKRDDDLPRTLITPTDTFPDNDALSPTIQSPGREIEPYQPSASPKREVNTFVKQAGEMDSGVYFAIAIIVLIAIVVAVIIRNSY